MIRGGTGDEVSAGYEGRARCVKIFNMMDKTCMFFMHAREKF